MSGEGKSKMVFACMAEREMSWCLLGHPVGDNVWPRLNKRTKLDARGQDYHTHVARRWRAMRFRAITESLSCDSFEIGRLCEQRKPHGSGRKRQENGQKLLRVSGGDFVDFFV